MNDFFNDSNVQAETCWKLHCRQTQEGLKHFHSLQRCCFIDCNCKFQHGKQNNFKVKCCVHNNSPTDQILCQLIPLHTLLLLCQINSNTIIHLHLCLPNALMLSNTDLYASSTFHICHTFPSQIHGDYGAKDVTEIWCANSGVDDDPCFQAVITHRYEWMLAFQRITIPSSKTSVIKGTRILHMSQTTNPAKKTQITKLSYIPSWGSCQLQAPCTALLGAACLSSGLQHTQWGFVKFMGSCDCTTLLTYHCIQF